MRGFRQVYFKKAMEYVRGNVKERLEGKAVNDLQV